MLDYYDQHLHTHHSFDSTERIENYLAKTNKQLVTTEHLDLKNPAEDFKDSIPDFKKYCDEINHLEQRFNRSILKGIEIGFVPNQTNDIKEFIQDKPYDVLLLSTHQNGEIDFMDPIVKSFETKRLIHDYYEQMIVSVENMPEANILTHFDYGMRQIDLSIEIFQQFAGPLLKQLFQLIIKNDIALELNAKSFITYGNEHLYDYAVPLYLSLGGTKFTLGSDAHVANDYELAFDEMKSLLKKNNVNQLVTYESQKPKIVTF